MPRFFVAICLPEDAQDRLFGVQPTVFPGTRLHPREDLHLTLHFLGEVADDHAGLIRQALANVKANPFRITLKGLGQFPPEGEPKVVWSAVEANPALNALHRSVGTVLTEAIGFRPEDRPYLPHVTLAYLNLPAPPGVIGQHLQQNKDFHVADVLINQFALYSSVLVNNVPRYEVDTVFGLDQ